MTAHTAAPGSPSGLENRENQKVDNEWGGRGFLIKQEQAHEKVQKTPVANRRDGLGPLSTSQGGRKDICKESFDVKDPCARLGMTSKTYM